MPTLVIEEVSDLDSVPVSLLEPSIFEREDPSSLLYKLNDEEIDDEDEFDHLLEDEAFATAMGQRILALTGYEVDDSMLSLRQLMLGGASQAMLQEFRARHPRRFDVYRGENQVYMLPRLRDWHLMPSERSSHTTYHVLPGGYLSAIEIPEDEDDGENDHGLIREDEIKDIDMDSDVDLDLEDDLLLHDEDDDYMDWLGVQLLKRKAGAPMWVIDSVQERPQDSGIMYTLWESDDDHGADEDEDHAVSMSFVNVGTSPNSRPRKTVKVYEP
ncbi:hypothetical protein Malapachy_3811 [Malassezia pachydermatis]|uniref:Uncharacterized protein n=1 Tax=Malassezia pachydermatis TaxID=77020 RepID=A0A0M8MU39_9BASI|nr:hypothetical protein Malapachy_3811 [Malassezia pachydermatis]KOS14364.1 hypothetical protein Malapachy_3811 [Malassezia pachydermatis]